MQTVDLTACYKPSQAFKLPHVCTASQSAGVVHGDTLFLVGNLQSPNPEERPVLPTTIVMCQYHFPTQKWTRLKLRGAPEICHYPLLAAHKNQLILFGGEQAAALLQSGCMQKSGCCCSGAMVNTDALHLTFILHTQLGYSRAQIDSMPY